MPKQATAIRLELDQRRAQAVHAALNETLHAQLVTGDRLEAVREVLEHLDRRVPGWLEQSPVSGEAGYLVAAEAVLRVLVDAEDGYGRMYAADSLSESDLLRALGDAKPLGATANDVLDRMTREGLVYRRRPKLGDERWWAAAPAGRQFLNRDTARTDAWIVRDALELLDLIYVDGRGWTAFRPWVQAIGHLEDEDLEPLLAALRADGLLDGPPDAPPERRRWLELSSKGRELGRQRWRDTDAGRFSFSSPPRAPLPYQRRLPIRGLTVGDRSHPKDDRDGWDPWCPPAAWMTRSSKTKLWTTFKRDGVVEWTCRHCNRAWLVYLQAVTRDDEPAYGNPAAAAYNRPEWRARGWR